MDRMERRKGPRSNGKRDRNFMRRHRAGAQDAAAAAQQAQHAAPQHPPALRGGQTAALTAAHLADGARIGDHLSQHSHSNAASAGAAPPPAPPSPRAKARKGPQELLRRRPAVRIRCMTGACGGKRWPVKRPWKRLAAAARRHADERGGGGSAAGGPVADGNDSDTQMADSPIEDDGMHHSAPIVMQARPLSLLLGWPQPAGGVGSPLVEESSGPVDCAAGISTAHVASPAAMSQSRWCLG